uniref:Uncharacterized protein n=1 Tax=Acrobeloides nanus TaxID=290746 RepID=A0A914DYF2_9BILA
MFMCTTLVSQHRPIRTIQMGLILIAVTTENVIVQDMIVGTTHGLSVGSEMSGGVRNVTFQNIIMNGSGAGPRIKSERGRGGTVQDITYTNLTLYNVDTAVYITMNYHTNPQTNETGTPKFVNININNIYADKSSNSWYLDGLPESLINNTFFSNMNFTNTKNLIEKCDNIIGICDNSTVSPYCPSCIQAEPCVDMNNECSQYLTQCNNPKYRE